MHRIMVNSCDRKFVFERQGQLHNTSCYHKRGMRVVADHLRRNRIAFRPQRATVAAYRACLRIGCEQQQLTLTPSSETHAATGDANA